MGELCSNFDNEIILALRTLENESFEGFFYFRKERMFRTLFMLILIVATFTYYSIAIAVPYFSGQ
jgi:hypothetical protein